jgi:hypothetical protein
MLCNAMAPFVIRRSVHNDTSSITALQDVYQKMSDISTPHKNDVLMGRGGNNNQHSGNERLRGVARTRCEDYRRVSKKGKSDISRELIKSVRKWTPPGRCVSTTTTMFCHSLSFGLTSCLSHLAHRFLRKDPHTSKWEDVGDDIAREKTSQVLRDAVALQSGPAVAKDTNRSYREQDAVGGSAARSSQRRAYPGQSVVFSQQPEPRSNQTCSRHPYVAYMESMNDTSSSSGTAPHHPTVTPASATGRKRPRYYESPVPAAYVYPPQHSSIVTNTPTEYMIRSPPHWLQNCRPSPPAYYPAASSVYSAAPSPAFHSHYSPQSYSGQTPSQPWVPDVPPYAAPSTTGTNNEFDLFNGELLSPERGEGAISHFA